MVIVNERLKELYKSGMRVTELSILFGVTRQTIHQRLKQMRLKRVYRESRYCVVCGNHITPLKTSKIKHCPGCYQKYLKDTALSDSYNTKRVAGLSVRQWQRKAWIIARTYAFNWDDRYRVHHLNGDITNSDPANLFVFYDHGKHMAYHNRVKHNKSCLPLVTDGFYCK